MIQLTKGQLMLNKYIKTIRTDVATYADTWPLSEKERERFPNCKWAYRLRKNKPLSFSIEDSEDIDVEVLLESISHFYNSMIFRAERGPDYTLIRYYGKII